MKNSLPYHAKPTTHYKRGKRYGGVTTPYQWSQGGDWRIGFGASSFLIAKGSGFSTNHGKKLFRQLEDEWLLRRKSRQPKARVC